MFAEQWISTEGPAITWLLMQGSTPPPKGDRAARLNVNYLKLKVM